jgi:hypothetical protein
MNTTQKFFTPSEIADILLAHPDRLTRDAKPVPRAVILFGYPLFMLFAAENFAWRKAEALDELRQCGFSERQLKDLNQAWRAAQNTADYEDNLFERLERLAVLTKGVFIPEDLRPAA